MMESEGSLEHPTTIDRVDIERIAALPLEERAAALTALIEELEEKLESTVTPHENPSPTKD